LPISFHHYRKTASTTREQLETIVGELYPNTFTNKSVLLIDDNANTGGTVQVTHDIVTDLGAKTTEVHLTQHDPERLLDSVRKTRYGRVFNIEHPKYHSTMGVVPINAGTRQDNTFKMIKQRLKIYYARQEL